MNQRQTGKIIDLLSEGPIEGIVGDDAGIFLNGTPVIDAEERETLGYVPGEISFVSGVTYDFTPDSGFDLTEIDLATGDRNIIVWDAIDEGSTDAYIKAQKHSYVLKTPNVTWTNADIGSLIILGDGQNGATETFRVASIHTYSGPNSFIKIDRASQGPYGDSNTRQLWRAQIRQVQSIVNSTRITVNSAFTESFTNRKATLLSINSTSLDTSVSTKNFESVKTIFRSGRQDQPILDPVFGGGQTAFATNLNEELLQTTRSGPYSISGQDDKVYTATTTMGISSPENIDKVKINIRFPSLIAYSKSGSEYSQGIEFQIFLEYRRNGVWYNHTGTLANLTSNQPVFGISDDDIQNRNPVNTDDSTDTDKRVTKYALAVSKSTKNDGMVVTRSKTEFVKEFLIDSELTKSKPFTDFRIRIKRVTGVNIAIRKESQAQTQSYMQGLFAYSNDILNYANTAVAGISFQSNDFDEFPKRAYLARGIRVQVPTNYITREESGGSQAKYTRNVTTGADTGSEVRWDGKFRGDIADTSWRTNQGHVNYKKVYTNNPAWVYYDIMVNNRYGLGEFLGAQNINKYELYRIARYCDELVPDGKGGTEPRFTCNLYLQSRTEAFKVINDLASVFRSIVKWTNGEISASQDAPKAPIYTFSNSNVLDGQFGYESTSKRLRINQVGVTWNNPEDFYKQDVVTVEDSESILEEGKIIKKDTIAVGCTSEGQATRLGKWMLLTERLETELVKFRTGINGAYLRPGDIFYVQDYNRTNAIASGRLAQSNNHTTTTVYFDRPVPFEADTYQLHLAFPTGSAYLQQEQATINGTTYYRGDQITQAYVGGVLTNIDSTEDAADALDAASGNFVQLSWSEYISVESREFVSGSNQNLDSITVSSAFTSVPNSEVMFTLTNITDSNTAKGAVAYRTLNITENEDKTIDISGHLYLADKFAAVDRGYLLQPREFTPLPTFDNIRVPAPQNPSLSINRLSDTEDSTDVQLYSYVAEVSWGHPVVEGTNENYQYVDYYEIKHPYTQDRTYERAKATKATEFTFTSFVDPGQAYVLVRTVNIQGRRSAWSVVERAGTSDLTGSALNTISFLNLRAGGNVDTSLSVTVADGSVSFENENFNVIGPQGNNYSLTGISTLSQGSPEISNGEYAYIVFDSSSSSFKFLEIETDTVAEDPATGLSPPLNFEYWRESGQNDFTSVGTISQDIDTLDLSNGSPGKALFVNKFTTTADYSSSFSFGDIIRIGSGASSWYGTVLEATTTQITTVEYINKAFSSGASIFNQDFKADNALDFIIGRIYNNAAIYELEIFAATKGSKGDTPETVSLSADSFVVKYDGDEVLLEGSPNNNITLTATPGGGLGIEGISPEYRFIEMPSTVKQDWSTSATYTIPEADLPAINTTIQYKVEATDDGSPYTSEASDFLTIVTVAEGRDAETVNLEADNYVAKYDGTGTLIDSSPTNNITLTATSSAGLSSPTQYRFTELPSTVKQDWSTDNTYVIPQVDLPEEDTTITYKVEVTDGASPYSSEASDTVTIAAISDGSVGSPGTDGRPGLPGASRILPYDNLQSSLPNAAGQYAFLSGSTPTYVTSWADIKSAEVIQLRPFTDPLTTNQSQYYDQIKEGDIITYYITSGKWVDYVVDVNNGLTGSPGAYEFEVTALEFDETGGTADPSTADGVGVKFRFSRATEAISGVITNDTHAEAADQDGTLLNDLTDAGGNFLVFKGIQEVTNESPAPSFGRSPATIDGLTMSIDAAGVYSLSGTWTGTQAQFELTATYEGFTVTKQYTIVKTLEGAASVLGFLTNESHVEAANNAGDLLDTLSDAGGTFTVFDGIVDVTTGSGVVYSVVGGSGSPSVLTTSGLQMSINTSTGIYTLSENSDWTADTTTFTLRAVYSAHSPSVTVDRVYTISKSKTGLDGQDAIVVDPSAATSDGGASDFKDRIVFTDNTTLEYFVWEDNTSIFKRATSTNAFTALDISLSAGSQGSINVVAGDRITTNKPVSFLDDYTNVPSLAYAANIFTGKIYRAGYQFKLFRVFAPYQDADVEIWFGSTAEINDSPVTVSFTASYDTFTEQSYNNSGESSEGDARFVIRASAPVIVGFSQDTSSTTWTGGFDQQILVPPSNKVLMPNFSGANKQVSLLDPNGSSSTVNETSPIDASYTTSTDTLLHVSGIGDGDGTDSQHGIPTVWTADHYALPIDLDYYQVSAIEPCVVKVYQISNGALLDTFDFTNASETNIETGSRGTIAGSTIASNGAYFVGTGRFSVYGNPTSTGDELTPHGWYSKLRTVVENPPTATITGATLVDAQGNVIPDSVITNYEDSSTLKYNGQFTEFQTNGFPVGWDDIDGVYGNSTGIWSQHTGTNPDPLSGSSCLKYDYNGTSPAASYIVRQPSDRYALFPEPPKVNLTVAGNAVVVGSIDVYIESGFSQPGNPPQLLMDLVTAYNSPVEYFRRFVTADSSITDEWQRLYFITSQETSTVYGGATVGDPIIDIRAVIYPNNFQGVVFWDNLRFSILDPSVDNEQQLWQDIKGTYGSGVNMCISGWDSASSAEFISANIGVTDGSGAFSTAQGKFDGTSVLITATSGAPCIVYAADNASDYNMPLQPSTSYIVSVYVRPSVQPATTFTVGIRQDNGTVKESANLRTDLVANQWTRVHALITTDSGVTSQGNIRILGDHSSSFTFYLDGLMVEEYLGGSPFSTGPSQFVKSGTFGATSGISLYSASGSILGDIDIRDDQKALTLMGGSIVPNAGFGDYYRVNRYGNSAPRHWYGSGSANAVQFLSDTQRDVVFIAQTSGLRYSSDAFSVNLDTEYEVAILARKSVGGDATRLRVRVQELESDMPTGKRFLSSVNVGSPGDPKGEDFLELELADNTISLTNPNVAYASGTDWDLTTSFDIYYGTYTPSTSLVRWASIYFDAANNNPATGNLEVEWFTIRDKSTLGATSGVNLKDSQNNVITDDQILFSDEAAALAFNPGFLSWSGGQLLGYDYTNADSITQFSGTSPTSPLIGGSMAYFNSTNGVNNSLRRVHGGDSPNIPMNFSTDSVVIGSLDVFINSFTTGTAPGIEVTLLETSTLMGDGSNSGYRAVVPFDTSATGKWQRVYFKVSKASVGNLSDTLGSPTGTADFKTIRLTIGSIAKSDTGRGAMGQSTSQYYIDNLKLNAVDPSLENDQQLWADISGAGLPEDNATVGAQTNKNITNEVLVEEDFADFNLTRVLQTWDEPTGATSGEISIISTSVAKNYGGYALRVGNNSGNDEYRLVVDRARAMPLEFNQLYKITFVAKTTSTGSPPALAFLGLQGWKGNVRNGGGTSVTNTGGTGIGTIGHYIATRNSELTTDFQEYTAYFKRNINTGSVSASNGENLYNSPLNPWFIHTDAEFVSPLMILNFSLRAGITEVSYVKLEKVEPPSVSEQPTDGGALLINPNFNIPNAENIDRPAGWWSGTSTTQPEYDDKSTSELLGSSDTVVSNAFKVDTDKKYRVTARIKAASGNPTVSINVNEYNSDLDVAGGKYAIGGSFNTDPIQQRNQNKALSPAVATKALTTTYEIITGLYTPTSTTKWASLNFYDNATSAFILDWVTIEVEPSISGGISAPAAFNYDDSSTGGGNFQPRAAGLYYYTLTASTSDLGIQGRVTGPPAIGVANTPWLRSYVKFYRGETEIAEFVFIHMINYVESGGGRSANWQEVKSLWRSSSYATGYSDSDFTVKIDNTTKSKWDGTVYSSLYEYWSPSFHDGTKQKYAIEVVHDETGYTVTLPVSVEGIAFAPEGEAPK